MRINEWKNKLKWMNFLSSFFRDGFIGCHMQCLILTKMGWLQLTTGNSETLVKNHVEQVPRKQHINCTPFREGQIFIK